ncbi:glycosyltransferase [Ilumatobacter coccineus]|uniref:4,4'-diaponeurosporenoate glycosyltransferase n=1 Tax=Ilumatobacter coccineus (strain NBRC 103263 / KCTC 29153 / YM16-304) TaxID=1313172 RepID=A0A6C7EHV0_ILUCY|nr:glycosyltransferase [Ilumatobacter coccineus]BAN03556.1 putative glycosyltransferase [Ilumatobacter coccineus YM16-304]
MRFPPRRHQPAPTMSHIAVVVPARDEAASIGDCLDSINIARSQLPADVRSTVVVVADRCRDDTVRRALDRLAGRAGDVVIETDRGNAGAARQFGARCVLSDLVDDPSRVWMANTDADTTVDPDWLTRQLELAARGVVAVAGIVRLRYESTSLALVESFERSYERGDDGSHPHVHGANLGFRADAFLAVGEWNALATGEDHDLWNRLRLFGPVESTTSLCVTTSARIRGRAPNGFAANLAALDASIEPVA